jgi:hypothetical protein
MDDTHTTQRNSVFNFGYVHSPPNWTPILLPQNPQTNTTKHTKPVVESVWEEQEVDEPEPSAPTTAPKPPQQQQQAAAGGKRKAEEEEGSGAGASKKKEAGGGGGGGGGKGGGKGAAAAPSGVQKGIMSFFKKK